MIRSISGHYPSHKLDNVFTNKKTYPILHPGLECVSSMVNWFELSLYRLHISTKLCSLQIEINSFLAFTLCSLEYPKQSFSGSITKLKSPPIIWSQSILIFCNFGKSYMFLVRNELRDPILPLVFFSVGQTEIPEISFFVYDVTV